MESDLILVKVWSRCVKFTSRGGHESGHQERSLVGHVPRIFFRLTRAICKQDNLDFRRHFSPPVFCGVFASTLKQQSEAIVTENAFTRNQSQ